MMNEKDWTLAEVALGCLVQRGDLMDNWSIIIPSQGIEITGGKAEAVQFLNNEIAYFTKLAITGQQITLGGQGYGALRISDRAIEALSKIVTDVQADKSESFEEYVRDAQDRRVLVGASPTGRRVEELKSQSEPAAALLAAIYSAKWMHASHPAGQDIVLIFRSIAFASPANFAFDNLLVASETIAEAKETNQRSNAAAEELSRFIDEKRALIEDLEDLYRNKLTIEEPALSWEKIAGKKTRIWSFWLAVFAILAVAPLIAALEYWSVTSLMPLAS
ncbi:DUF6161 domain-containing protein [Bradyrhizobium sp. PMVTL-01]|uniref:DUF6161 domain-containing protein n=1 Tax=Bradyrhizobium sp. PMVTL-01 TaxID=3434999 RepID=UPI003F6F1D05